MSNNRVYVGNLAYSVNNYDLKNFMLQAGEVVRATVLCNAARHSRGCGIVEFATAEEAQNAIDSLQNVELKGRMVFIREDREPPRASSSENNTTGTGGVSGASGSATESVGGSVSSDASAVAAGGIGSSGTDSGPANASGIDSAAPARSAKGTPTSAPARANQRTGSYKAHASPAQAGTAVFVSNLPFSVTWYELKELFAAAGEIVRADVHMVHHRSKGHGTVVFTNEQGAQAAIQRFNGYQLDSRPLEVRMDVPSWQRPGAFLWCSGFGEPSETVFVSNLPWNTTDADLFELFQSIAPLTHAQLQMFPDGRQSGNGVVRFENQSSAAVAVEQLNGYNYGSRPLHVSFARYQQNPTHA